MHTMQTLQEKVALITGAAHRIGAAIARILHNNGMHLVVHYHQSQDAAQELAAELNAARPDTVTLLQADLLDTERFSALINSASLPWGRLDVLVNNASSFYPTQVGEVTLAQWNELIGTNLRAPFFLAQAATPMLAAHQGCIINIVDIHGDRPLKSYPVYSIAKAGLVMLTKTMARELGPRIRVNAVAPGAILWPEHELGAALKADIIARTALKRQGNPQDIARAVLFLIRDAEYMTGQILTVDGGRSLGT